MSLKAGGWSAVAPGVECSYRSGRKALVTIRRDPADESFHEWRKRVKDLWYQVRCCGHMANGMCALGENWKLWRTASAMIMTGDAERVS